MKLVVLGLNHRSAAVEVRERFSFDKDEVASALNRLYEFDCVAECVILSCNAIEPNLRGFRRCRISEGLHVGSVKRFKRCRPHR